MGEAYDIEYGRIGGFCWRPAPAGAGQPSRFIPALPDRDHQSSPTLTAVAGDGTQIWKMTHNGVDTHTIHFHAYNVQIPNRVSWDNAACPRSEHLGERDDQVNPSRTSSSP
jgi:hypothetical protein